jgi:hypothetical protein
LVLGIDFDGTVVDDRRPYDDVTSPLVFKPGAKRALRSLKKAGHLLILWSARSSPVLLLDPGLDLLVRAGVKKLDLPRWHRMLPVHHARHRQMLDFVAVELPGIFDAIDDGAAGKLSGVDLFIDDRTLRLGKGVNALSWEAIAEMLGEPVEEEAA